MLIVNVEVELPGTGRLVAPAGYENEQTGGTVTSGVTDAQESVTLPEYPLLGFTLTMPCAPLPAITLLGATALWMVIVNCALTASTVSCNAGVVYVVVGPVPVIVMLYKVVVVVPLLVIVAVALAGAVTDDGLTVHTGVSVVVMVDVTWQLKATLPVNPLTDPTWMEVDEVPPGAIALGNSGEGCSVNSLVPPCAAAAGTKPGSATAIARTNTHQTGFAGRASVNLILDSEGLKFAMNCL